MLLKNLVDNIASSPGRFPELDGLRAIAIILVLLRHGISEFSKKFPNHNNYLFNSEPLSNLFFNGWVGVDLFFILSGFLVGFHLLKHWPENTSKLIFMTKYWFKRILRTFPLYYAILLIVYFELVPFYSHSSNNPNKDLINHILFLQDYYGANFLVSFWSLATEEKFYFISPFLMWFILIKKDSNSFFVIIIGSLIALSFTSTFNYLLQNKITNYNDFFWIIRAPFHMAVNGILFGLIIAFFYQNKTLSSFLTQYSNTIIIISISLISVILFYENWIDRNDNWLNVVLVLFLLLLLFSIVLYSLIYSSTYISKFMSSKVMRLISKLSYSLYLVHLLTIPGSILLYIKLDKLGLGESFAFIGYSLTYFLISLFFSIILHVLIERPFIRIKDRVRLN